MKIKQSKIYLYGLLMMVFLLSSCTNNTIPSTPVENTTEPAQSEPTFSPTTVIETEPPLAIKKLFIYHTTFEDPLIQETLNEITVAAEGLGFEVSRNNELPDGSFSSILLFHPTEEILLTSQGLAVDQIIVVAEEIPFSPTIPTTFIKLSQAETIFLAGYLSALITNDWRVGGLLPDNQYNNTDASKIFQNGMIYLCGRCTPVFGPIVKFPVTAILSTPENTEATMQAFGEIATNRINTLFIPSIYLNDDLVTLLKQNNVTIISDSYLETSLNGWVDYSITTNVNDLVLTILSNDNQPKESVNIIPAEYAIHANATPISVGRENFL
ncbi:MAG TPA: hypothetical protein VK856_09775, partial [Anaerolineaceae bacterium]|nr:hypothetical protein [Anaerolineaceae bacterium]